MRKIFTLFLFVFSASTFAQECNFLDERNGFRDIKLGTEISNYPEFVKKDGTNVNLFKYNNRADYVYVGKESDKISNTNILYIYLILKDNLVNEITVFTHKEVNLYSVLKFAYGEPTSKTDDQWVWNTHKVRCTLEGGNSTTIPGCYIRYKDVSTNYSEVIKHQNENVIKAQNEL